MRSSTPPANVVSAARTGRRRIGHPRVRRLIFGGSLLVAVIAIATVALATDRHLREWATVIATGSVLAILIGWLTGASRSLSRSERDPSEFSGGADSY